MTRIFVWLQYLLPQHLLSRLIGYFAASKINWLKQGLIRIFAGVYRVDWQIAARQSPKEFVSFNDFFTRELLPGVRPISGALCCPADGVVSAMGRITAGCALQAKNHQYPIEALLGEALPEAFVDGSFLTIYLAPKDYHRVHFPVAGTLTHARYVPGDLFSVNAATTEYVPGLFTRNERLVLHVNSSTSQYYLILVGAMIVAGIQPFWRETPFAARRPDEKAFIETIVEQGQEAGRFLLGSTAIIISDSREPWRTDMGTTVKMGQALA